MLVLPIPVKLDSDVGIVLLLRKHGMALVAEYPGAGSVCSLVAIVAALGNHVRATDLVACEPRPFRHVLADVTVFSHVPL